MPAYRVVFRSRRLGLTTGKATNINRSTRCVAVDEADARAWAERKRPPGHDTARIEALPSPWPDEPAKTESCP